MLKFNFREVHVELQRLFEKCDWKHKDSFIYIEI